MVGLLDLPSELLLHVAEDLRVVRIPNPDWERYGVNSLRASIRDLAPLSLVSKEMRAITAPIMFEELQPSLSVFYLAEINDTHGPGDASSGSGFLTKVHLTALVKTFRVPNLRSIKFTNLKKGLGTAMEMVVKVLEACPELETVLDMPMICVERSNLVAAINAHPSLSDVWTDFSPSVTSSSEFRASLPPNSNLLHKLRGTLKESPSFPLKYPFQVILDQGLQIKRARLDWSLNSSSLSQWLDSSYLSTADEISFSQFSDEHDANIIHNGIRSHRYVSRVQLDTMSLTTIHHIFRLKIPPILSLLFPGRLSNADCTIDENRELRCRRLWIMSRSEPDTAALFGADVPEILTAVATSFPLLQELNIVFPLYLFPDGYNYATRTIIRTEDSDTVHSFAKFKNLHTLSLDIDFPDEPGFLDRLGDMIISLFAAMPSLRIVQVNPDHQSWFGDDVEPLVAKIQAGNTSQRKLIMKILKGGKRFTVRTGV